MLSYWWLIELPYWFKSVFLLKILGIYRMQYAKDSRGEIQSMQGEIKPNIGKVEFLKFL